MASFIEAKCPNCGAKMEFPNHLDKAFCSHCGSEFIVADDDYETHKTKPSNTCAYCRGSGEIRCSGMRTGTVKSYFRTYELFAESCSGTGKCIVYCYPEKVEPITNYCNHGKCSWCKGTGRIFFRTCRFCDGTGNCPFCHGSGKCTICNGKGEIRCKVCDGRGVKVH